LAVGGTASIFRIDTNGDTETTAEAANETVEFNGTSLNPDDRSYTDSLEIHYILRIYPYIQTRIDIYHRFKTASLERWNIS